MTHYDTLITGATVVRPRMTPFAADVAIVDGTIAALLDPGTEASADTVVDASGLHVLPGSIDPHAHIALGGGMSEYDTDTLAAARGGVTTMFYMLSKGTPYLPALQEHYESASALSHIDFGFHVTLMTDEHLAEVPAIKERFGLRSYKYYMHFRGNDGHYLGVEGTDDGKMYAILERVAEFDDLLLIHAENPEVVWLLQQRMKDSGREDLAAWDEARPAFVEAEAIRRATYMADHLDASIYFVHVSTTESLAEIRRARHDLPSLKVSVETCPHYLTHTTDYERGVVGKVNPPLRTASHTESVWEAVADGTVTTMGSDHVGRRLEAKQGTIWEASAGFPGAPTSLPVLITQGHLERGIPLERIVEITAKQPAELLRIDDSKGDIAPGMDADLAIVDLATARTADPAWLGTYADYSLYENTPLRGWARHTFVRGHRVIADGSPTGLAASGRYVRDAAVNA